MINIALLIMLSVCGFNGSLLQDETQQEFSTEFNAIIGEIRSLQSDNLQGALKLDDRITKFADKYKKKEVNKVATLLGIWASLLNNHNFNKPELCLKHLTTAIDLFNSKGMVVGVLQMRVTRANVFAYMRRYEEELLERDMIDNILSKASKNAEKSTKFNFAWNAFQRASCFVNLYQYDEAFAQLDRSNRFYEEIKDNQLPSNDLPYLTAHLRGLLYSRLEKFTLAFPHLEKAYHGLSASKDKYSIRARHLCGIASARVHVKLGQGSKALDLLKDSAEYFKKKGDWINCGMCHSEIGVAYMIMMRMDEAISALKKAMQFFHKGDFTYRTKSPIINTHKTMGICYKKKGDYPEAMKRFNLCERLCVEQGDHLILNDVLMARASLFRNLGRHQEAKTLLHQAMEKALECDRPFLAAAIASEFSMLHLDMQDHKEALDWVDKAEKLFIEAGETPGSKQYRLNNSSLIRAHGFAKMGQVEKSIEAIESAEKIYRKKQDIQGLISLAMLKIKMFIKSGRLKEAQDLVSETEALYAKVFDESDLIILTTFQGVILSKQGEFEKALSWFKDAGEQISRCLERHINPLGEKSSVTVRRTLNPTLARVMDSFYQIKSPSFDHINTAYHISQAYHGLGIAEILAEQSVTKGEKHNEFLKDQSTELKIRLKSLQQERAGLMVRQKNAPSLEERKTLRNKLDNIQKEIVRSESDLDRVAEKARLEESLYISMNYPKPASLAEVQSLLPDGCALLEYVETGSYLDAFAITSNQVWVKRIGSCEKMRQDVQGAIDQIRNSNPLVFSKALYSSLRKLGKKTLDPIFEAMGEYKPHTLIIAPDSHLCRISFDAMLTKDINPEEDMRNWPFLVKEYAIAYNCSGTLLREFNGKKRRPAAQKPTFVAFGYPDYGESGAQSPTNQWYSLGERNRLLPLPHTAREVLGLAGLFCSNDEENEQLRLMEERFLNKETQKDVEMSGERFHLFMGSAANEWNLKNHPAVKNATILHLACHGLADTQSPALSCLALSIDPNLNGAAMEDGLITLREIKNLGLNAEIIVLSACGAGSGVLRPYDGITGMGRAAMIAGAQSVLSTLWEVQDRSAQQLMIGFYVEWLENERIDRIQALALAKRKAILGNMPIKTWAAYTLWDIKAP